MKIILIFDVIFILILNVDNAFSDNSILSGNITNPTSFEIYFNSHKAVLDSSGSFCTHLDTNMADFYSLRYSNKSVLLFLSPLDSLFISFDAKDFNNSLTYAGKGSHYNNYLFKQHRLDEKVTGDFRKNFVSYCSLDEKLFIDKMDSINGIFTQELKTFIAQNEDADTWFIKHEKASNLFGWAETMIWYPYWHKRVTKTSIALSQGYYQRIADLDINDSDFIKVEEYISFMNAYLDHLAREKMKTDESLKKLDNQWNTAKIQTALKLFTHPTIKDYWLGEIINDQIDNYGIKNTENLMALFDENCTNSQSRKKIRTLYEKEKLRLQGHLIKSYKSIHNAKLDAHIFHPPQFEQGNKYPTIVFLHGGSWSEGSCSWYFGACEYYASLGMVAISAEYRTFGRHGVTPLEGISDGKSLIRWLRKNANELGVDPNRIVTCGYSAGGHIAACASMLDILDEPNEDLKISSSPNALIFYYSVFDPTLDRWFVEQVSSKYTAEECSPNHNIRPGLPPSLVLHGTNDRNCPFWTAKVFTEKMKKAGNHCVFHVLKGAGHVFQFNEKYKKESDKAVYEFLHSLGYL